MDCKIQKKQENRDILKNSPSMKIVRKLCNRGVVSVDFKRHFKQQFGALKAAVHRESVPAVDDEDYWLGNVIHQLRCNMSKNMHRKFYLLC